MKNQKGFGVMIIVIIFVILIGVGLVGWKVYDRNAAHQKSAANLIAQKYSFSPVQLDTSKWQNFEPFQGFSFKYPTEWEMEDSGEFETFSRRVTGIITDTRTVNITSKATYLFSKDLDIEADQSGYKRDRKEGEVSKGSRISLTMTARNPGEPAISAEDNCSYFPHLQTKILKFESYQVCQVRVADPSGEKVYAYDFHTTTDKVEYLLTVSFSPSSSAAEKNQYISVAREIVASYKLY